MAANDYDFAELEIALNPNDPRHILPPRQGSGARVLDVGCGAGQSLIAAYPDRFSFGIDVSLDALKTGRTLTTEVVFTNAVAEALPFKNNCFDFVFSRVALPYTNILDSLRQMRRVLKAEGRIWLALHSLPVVWKQAQKSNIKGKLWFGYVVLNSLAFHSWGKQFRFRGRYESFQTEAGIRRALRQAGFADIQVSRGQHFIVTARAQKGSSGRAALA